MSVKQRGFLSDTLLRNIKQQKGVFGNFSGFPGEGKHEVSLNINDVHSFTVCDNKTSPGQI